MTTRSEATTARPLDRNVMRVAALFVQPDGCYAGLPGVDSWPEHRDARLYCGPLPAWIYAARLRVEDMKRRGLEEKRGIGAVTRCCMSNTGSRRPSEPEANKGSVR